MECRPLEARKVANVRVLRTTLQDCKVWKVGLRNFREMIEGSRTSLLYLPNECKFNQFLDNTGTESIYKQFLNPQVQPWGSSCEGRGLVWPQPQVITVNHVNFPIKQIHISPLAIFLFLSILLGVLGYFCFVGASSARVRIWMCGLLFRSRGSAHTPYRFRW